MGKRFWYEIVNHKVFPRHPKSSKYLWVGVKGTLKSLASGDVSGVHSHRSSPGMTGCLGFFIHDNNQVTFLDKSNYQTSNLWHAELAVFDWCWPQRFFLVWKLGFFLSRSPSSSGPRIHATLFGEIPLQYFEMPWSIHWHHLSTSMATSK